MNYFLFYLFVGVFSNPSDSIIVIEKTITIEADKIFADHFDNLYIISDNSLMKYNSEGKKLSAYFPGGGEEITDIDIHNPYKISLFFEKQNKIIFLDNNLNPFSNEISLEKIDIFGKSLFTCAIDGGYWIFDSDKSELIKFNSKFIIEYKKDLFFSKEQVNIKVNKSYLIFQSGDGQILFYNINSNIFDSLLSLSIEGNFFIRENMLIYYNYKNQSIIIINLISKSKQKIILPVNKNIENAVIGHQKVFFCDESNVYISSVK